METATIIIGCIVIIGTIIGFVGIFTWLFDVPSYLKRIAIALEKIANKKEVK